MPRRAARLLASSRRDGWTLVELMVVVSLIVVLAGMAMANYRNSVRVAQEAVLRENLFRMRDAIDQYYADKGKYPSSLDALQSSRPATQPARSSRAAPLGQGCSAPSPTRGKRSVGWEWVVTT